MVFLYEFDGNVWIGASPETLLKVEGEKVKTMALAGSRPLGSKLEWGKKEMEEQAYVAHFVEQRLIKHCSTYKKFDQHSLIAGPLEHLCTEYEGKLTSNSFVELLNDLHPTPAVCGIPVGAAKKMISEFEIHKRRDYTGFIGVLSKNDKQFYVNLRSALIQEHNIYLFLGGGITKDSIPEDEWKETELKAKTLVQFL
jgi:isochorismate synthase